MTAFTASPADTVGISDSLSRVAGHPRARSDTVGVTDILHVGWGRSFSDTVGVSNALRRFYRNAPIPEVVGVTDSVIVTGNFIQYDTWRPVPKPDNTSVLVCRTPAGQHDTYAGTTHMTFWTIHPDGSKEKPEILTPALNGYGWVSYGHPEWSPDGQQIIIWVETSTSYELVLLDASGFGIF